MSQNDIRTPQIIEKIFYEDKALFNGLMEELRNLVLESRQIPDLLDTLQEVFPDTAEGIRGFLSRFPKECERNYELYELIDLKNTDDERRIYGLNFATSVNFLEKEISSVVEVLEDAESEVLQLDLDDSQIADKQSRIRKALNWVKKKVVPVLKRLMGKAWQILANLLTPKGWSIKGTVGSTILGLGSVELQITFGK